MADDSGEATLHLDLTSRTFDPKAYIRRMYSTVSHVDFERTLLQSVGREADVATGALKELIRDSIGVFISSKEAMDLMYTNDKSLFTGEAVDPIADVFQSVIADSKALVAPTAELFEVLRTSRMTRETLTKLMIVWRVPGVIYECCGARVPERQPVFSQRRKKVVIGEKDGRSSSEKGEHDDIADDDGGDRKDDDTMQRITRGALEELADGTGTSSDYVLHPDEELLFWHGTPLARRLRPHDSTNATDTQSNYEAAVLNLRRAMLYMEENYDMEHAAVLGVGAGDDEAHGVEQRRQQDGIALMYQYALALLRAALYLNEQMARELQQVSAADTVFIEDTLSSMMDTAIATVKLRHFCWTARSNLRLGADHNATLSELQRGLHNDDAGAVDGTKEDAGESSMSGAAPSFLLMPLTTAESSLATASAVQLPQSSSPTHTEAHRRQQPKQKGQTEPSPLTPPLQHNCPHPRRQRMEHPVEYYVRITRTQHVRMMEDVALRLSLEASEWRRKFISGHGDGRRDRRNKRKSTETLLTSFAAFAAVSSAGGSLVGANDSFTVFNSVGLLPLELTADASVSERIKVNGFGLDVNGPDEMQHAETILDAFRTPESNFARFTTFSVGEVDMSEVLECSATQLQMHAAGLLHQLLDHSNVEGGVRVETVATAPGANTFSHRLFAACLDRLEVVLVSYWGSIAAEVHAGVFDFTPDPSSVFYRMLNGHAVLGSCDSEGAKYEGKVADDELPNLRYIPVMQDGDPSLRQLSVDAMRKMVRAASDVLYALLLTTVNRTVLRGFVRAMAVYRAADVSRNNEDDDKRGSSGTPRANDEHIELHAAILVEVILAQWEKAMTHVDNSVRRMKVVIGERCTSASFNSEAQVQEVGELLEELEQLRSNLFRCYTHGVGMLTKAYVTLLPSIQRPVTSNRSSGSVCTRLSREFVSSVLVNKLLNVISVVVDRTACFLNRFGEVYDGVDLFAAKAERSEEGGEEHHRKHGRPSRAVRRKPAGEKDMGTTTQTHKQEEQQLDNVTAFMAHYNSRVVLDHIAEHEEMLLALVANILLIFVDALHHKCQRISLDATATPEVREHTIIESLADALCLPTATLPLVISELVTPCVLQVVVRLTPDVTSPRDQHALQSLKEERFRANYLSRVEEHCQLVVDTMLSMFLSTPKQHITREVHAAGFMLPMMDWQRISAPTAVAVRPYIADSIVHIARAHERLQWLRQPLLGVTVTQHLVAHIALTFVTALTSDGNAFEISFDCSSSFLSYGLLLIEAEGRAILGIIDALLVVVAKNPQSGIVLPELTVAREVLQGTVALLQRQGSVVCEALAARNGKENSSSRGDGVTDGGGGGVLTTQQREAQCEAMVQSAVQRSRFIVQAIITHLEESTITAAFKPLDGNVTESVAERLAKRKEGYHLAHKAQRKSEKHVKLPSPKPDVARKSTTTTATTAAAATLNEEENETVVTPRTAARVSVLQCAVKQEERRVEGAVVKEGIDSMVREGPRGSIECKEQNEMVGGSHIGREEKRRVARKNCGVQDERVDDVDTTNAIAAGAGAIVSQGSRVKSHRFKRTLVL